MGEGGLTTAWGSAARSGTGCLGSSRPAVRASPSGPSTGAGVRACPPGTCPCMPCSWVSSRLSVQARDRQSRASLLGPEPACQSLSCSPGPGPDARCRFALTTGSTRSNRSLPASRSGPRPPAASFVAITRFTRCWVRALARVGASRSSAQLIGSKVVAVQRLVGWVPASISRLVQAHTLGWLHASLSSLVASTRFDYSPASPLRSSRHPRARSVSGSSMCMARSVLRAPVPVYVHQDHGLAGGWGPRPRGRCWSSSSRAWCRRRWAPCCTAGWCGSRLVEVTATAQDHTLGLVRWLALCILVTAWLGEIFGARSLSPGHGRGDLRR